jgi:hypothetical protein
MVIGFIIYDIINIVIYILWERQKMKIDVIIKEVLDELSYATYRFHPFNNAHEGYAVILEENDELWDAIKMNEKDTDKKGRTREQAIHHEVKQVAAMAIRFMMDICEEVEG